MSDLLFDRVAVIGAGLIGSSIVRAFDAFGGAGHVAVYDRDASVRDTAERIGLGHRVDSQLASTVADADLIVVAVPVGAVAAVLEEIAPVLKPGAIVTDVGSVKETVLSDGQDLLPPTVHFVPGHPIAGTEQSGPEAGFADLFSGRWCILTPDPTAQGEGDEAAVAKVVAMWERFGSMVEIMDAAHHDRVLAITSHVPHLIAYNIVGTASDLEQVTQSEVVKFSAGGFRDFTRIAASDPVMWRDVFLNNKDAVLEMLGRFSEDLSALQRAIRWDKADELEELFTRTREIRRGIIEAGQETAAPNFGRKRGSGPSASGEAGTADRVGVDLHARRDPKPDGGVG